jgi:hypothetical protein
VASGENPLYEVFASAVEQFFVAKGSSQHELVRDFRISEITFLHASPAFMRNYSVPSGDDYAMHRGWRYPAQWQYDTVNCTVDHNLFDGIGGNEVWLNGFHRQAHISRTEFRNLGEVGIGWTGLTQFWDGTDGAVAPVLQYGHIFSSLHRI